MFAVRATSIGEERYASIGRTGHRHWSAIITDRNDRFRISRSTGATRRTSHSTKTETFEERRPARHLLELAVALCALRQCSHETLDHHKSLVRSSRALLPSALDDRHPHDEQVPILSPALRHRQRVALEHHARVDEQLGQV
jgi:hypothetical protein